MLLCFYYRKAIYVEFKSNISMQPIYISSCRTETATLGNLSRRAYARLPTANAWNSSIRLSKSAHTTSPPACSCSTTLATHGSHSPDSSLSGGSRRRAKLLCAEFCFALVNLEEGAEEYVALDCLRAALVRPCRRCGAVDTDVDEAAGFGVGGYDEASVGRARLGKCSDVQGSGGKFWWCGRRTYGLESPEPLIRLKSKSSQRGTNNTTVNNAFLHNR
ncbi:hypothetical protein B0H17DRAFT_307988 [Mycena rosella]|uniref:Uncharacterized protein n=1 Tax=Mycena rosella TaxID=1033263 RepID=A0AAD7DW59_MYCRO|nr:hypothetical protein B0H17DRAFT_307988 [Mycena rosella]